MQYLCAPMEGVTGDLFRQAQRQTFPAADSYYTPFLSPTANRTFSPRELREIEPAHNAGIHVCRSSWATARKIFSGWRGGSPTWATTR